MKQCNDAFELAAKAFVDRRIEEAIELLNRSERAGHDPDQCAAIAGSVEC
jgi:hypothetical protein